MNTDFYMTTEHRRKQAKGRVRFSMVMNKVLIGSVVLATLANPLNTVYAANTQQPNVPTANYTVEMQYEQSIENIKFKINNTISQLERLRAEENKVSKSLIKEMASGLIELESAIRSSGAEVTPDIFKLLDRAEESLKGAPDTYKEIRDARRVIERVRVSLGVSETITEEKKLAQVQLSDIQGHWGEKYITQLVARGGISGYPDGTFKPNNTITKAEFVAIAVRSALNGKVADNQGGHWAAGVFQTAREKQVLLLNDFPQSEWDKPITRYEMSYVMVRVAENILGEPSTSTSGVGKIMSDYQEVSKQQKYRYYVEQAFMKGLVTGKTKDGLFDGKANGTRAEAATMIVRMLETKMREVVDTNKIQQSEGREISLTDPNRPLVPKEGDIIIKPDGTRVVLKVGPAGVLGEGQGINYYEGIKLKNGYIFKAGDLGTTSMGYLGQTYLVDKRTGEGHFVLDWNAIRQYYRDAALKEYGHSAEPGTIYKGWVMYDGRQWNWLGPSN